jgi:hypothetical protein
VIGLSRSLVVAEMQARELARRRAVMGLFALLPAAFFYSIPADQDYGVLAGSIGVSWAVAAAGVFGILGWRRVDPRLALVGIRPRHGLIGRLVIGTALALLLVAVYAPLLLARSTFIGDSGAFVLGLVLLALVSVPLGLVIGALVPRELEGTLVLVGVVGVEMSIPREVALAGWLPLQGPLEVLQVSGNLLESNAIAGGVIRTIATAAILTAAAHLLWRRRVRVDTGDGARDTPIGEPGSAGTI